MPTSSSKRCFAAVGFVGVGNAKVTCSFDGGLGGIDVTSGGGEVGVILEDGSFFLRRFFLMMMGVTSLGGGVGDGAR
mgnify:CR=1 FL=1